jgi:hypothetical protein
MKLFTFQDYRKMELIQDAFIVMTPALLIIVSILWLLRNDWAPIVPMRLTNLITLYLHLY